MKTDTFSHKIHDNINCFQEECLYDFKNMCSIFEKVSVLLKVSVCLSNVMKKKPKVILGHLVFFKFFFLCS